MFPYPKVPRGALARALLYAFIYRSLFSRDSTRRDSPQICFDKCKGGDYTHFGTQYGKEVRYMTNYPCNVCVFLQ